VVDGNWTLLAVVKVLNNSVDQREGRDPRHLQAFLSLSSEDIFPVLVNIRELSYRCI